MSVYVALLFFCLFFGLFLKYEAIATVAGVNSKEAHDTKSSEMLNSPFQNPKTFPKNYKPVRDKLTPLYVSRARGNS